ncbi:MAG: cell division protein FtsA [Bryobacterales bacterium]|jgi:cell division protein FtsA|nr:cell division protein FtsA [Bryobacterales bacterium]
MSTNKILAAGLDAGSAWTRCVIALLEGDRFRFLGYGHAPSHGWAKGRITDQAAAAASIRAAAEEAEHMAQASIETVVAGAGGLSVRGQNVHGKWDLSRPREITQKDVNRAMERAMRGQLGEDRMILQVLPQDFAVDDHPGFQDPRGMVGSSLEANAQLLTTSAVEHTNLVTAINLAHLSVDETVFEAIAACYASVLPEERKEGVVLIDIGMHSTELICYYGDSAQLATSVRICGDHFSRDLAHALRIPMEAGAVVKEQFGGAVSAGTAANSVVELPASDFTDPHDRELRVTREVSRKFVNEILESRAVELFDMVRMELVKVGMQNAIASGIVLTGAGSLLPGLCDVAERVLECPVRLGLAQGILDWPEEMNDPAWATVAGLSMYAARLRSKVDVEKESVGLLGRILR